MATEETDMPELPPYPEMILSAINALGDQHGSSKTAIIKYIESRYDNLPSAYSTLVVHHLNRMKSSGELLFVKNNYTIRDPSSPAKRGRGRPPKPKPFDSSDDVPSLRRPRGRPPKSRDPSSTSSPPKKSTGEIRKRGRPPKKARPATDSVVSSSGAPRPRGRPPKVKPPVIAPVGTD